MAFRSRVVAATQLASFCGMLNYLSHSKTDQENKAFSFSERIHFVLQKYFFVLWWKCAPAAWFLMYRGAYEYVSGIISNLGDASLPQELTAINITAKTSLSETLVCSVCVCERKRWMSARFPFAMKVRRTRQKSRSGSRRKINKGKKNNKTKIGRKTREREDAKEGQWPAKFNQTERRGSSDKFSTPKAQSYSTVASKNIWTLKTAWISQC